MLQSFGFSLHVAELRCYSQVDLGNCHLTFSISSFEYRILTAAARFKSLKNKNKMAEGEMK